MMQTDVWAMRRSLRPTLAVAVLVLTMTAGCLGTEARSEWAYNATQLDALYDQGLRGKGIIVAVLDTGLNVDHGSLAHLVDGNKDNGELLAFKDYVNNKDGVENAYDDTGHGSHVVGIMSARGTTFGDKLTNGGVDLLGASPNIQLLVARVCSEDAGCLESRIDDAIRWAVGQGADIISISLGGAGGLGPLSELGPLQDDITREINAAIDRGIVVIASAGNDGPEAGDVYFPAVIRGVIAVGAINDDLRVASFSNYGDASANRCNPGTVLVPQSGRCSPHQKPEIVAPGTEILSAWTGDSYVRASGTSQATPFVTSAVALMLEGKPALRDRADVDQVKSALKNSAKPVEGQARPHDNGAGYGLLQAKAALLAYG